MDQKPFKSGFVSIVGKPNVGKSSLMNALMGENLSIITPKAQTTRHRIMGILTGKITRSYILIRQESSNPNIRCTMR